MADRLQVVHIGQAIASKKPEDVLVTYGLGSCVVVCLYDPMTKVGAMLHALLPVRPEHQRIAQNPLKYLDSGVPLLISEAQKLGARRVWMEAKLCGGARMLNVDWLENESVISNHLNIGTRNVASAHKALRSAGVRIVAHATGGSSGRTVKMRIADGRVTVKTLEDGEKVLTSTQEKRQITRG